MASNDESDQTTKEEDKIPYKLRLDIFTSPISLWVERWFLSSNAKDIGTLYLIYALLAGLVGTAFSVLIRLELSGPGVQFIVDNQLYNSIITAHAIIMIFFMVKEKKYRYIKRDISIKLKILFSKLILRHLHITLIKANI